MDKMRGFLGIYLGIVLVAACSDSSSSPTATSTAPNQPAEGGSGSGGSSGSGANSVGVGQSCGPLNGAVCSSGLHCCLTLSSNATACGATCGAGTLITDCTAPSDCKDPAKPVCCGMNLLGATAATAGASDGGAAGAGGLQCVATCPAGTSITFCATSADCPSGQACAAGAGTMGIKQCGAAQDGG